MDAVIKKWGNSAAVRIPAGVLADAKLSVDQPVAIREEQGRIVIEPVLHRAFSIRTLVKGIHADNLHEAIDTGVPVGREFW